MCLKFNEFGVNFEKKEVMKSTLELTLGSLVMEDLVQGAESPHRVLATSISKERTYERQTFAGRGSSHASNLSMSCPEFWHGAADTHPPESGLSSSLPRDLNPGLPAKVNILSHNSPIYDECQNHSAWVLALP